ncbi:MAG TPA: phosphoribosylanthranilate isomerase [Acidimicrobiales bacterium]|nr:phosphoribosylanthranilate isomerase [Acidimicrobiales bacterium]
MFVKICGITTEEDALLAVAMGADAVGFNFVPSSSRFLAVSRAADIAKRLPPEILTVGVFRDEAPARVVELTNQAGLRAAQLHGHESAEETRWVRQRVPVVIRAFPGGDPELARAVSYGADVVLLDSASPGSGKVFDWSLAEGAPSGLRILLAGGLTPDNVAEAIERVRPWGVDVASGVESAPGVKDPSLVRRFVRNAKEAEPADYHGNEDTKPFDWQLD